MLFLDFISWAVHFPTWGAREAGGWAQGQNDDCRVLPIPHSGACTSSASSRNIGLDRRGCSIVVGWTTISYRSTLLFLFVCWVWGTFASFPMEKVIGILSPGTLLDWWMYGWEYSWLFFNDITSLPVLSSPLSSRIDIYISIDFW